ncbi:division/cell wall cluster transcriptional repressor MraZ [Catalinimonas sp. 4WD22]|uniref:division/cell wall cluster transcriptional repressor MraZ n=1 Tax=Catalinimonas locisalis TaxID=3133978 RepID=UPI003101766D
MAIFTGEYECKLDAKGRVLLPAKVKAKLPECSKHEIVLSQGFEPCLIIYTIEEYTKKYEKFSSLSSFNEEQRKLQRNFFRGSMEVELDNMGRFLIPKRMAQYARLGREVIIAGNGNFLEIWNPITFEEYLFKDPKEFSAQAQKHLYNDMDPDRENNESPDVS